MLSSFVAATVRIARAERRDKLNVFYELEALAQGPRADHPWIVFHGQRWTYKEAYDTVLKYGTWLRGRGVQPGEVVAMDFVNSETFIWVWFGLWSIGAKPAFINYNLTGKPLMHTIKTSTARLVFVDEESKANFAEHVMAEHGFTPAPATAAERAQANFDFEMDQSEVPRSVKDQALAQAQPQGITSTSQKKQLEVVFFDKHLADSILMLQPTRQPDSCRANQKLNSMAMLIYTSGTTGLPKPAVMSWGKVSNIVSFIITTATKFNSAIAAQPARPSWPGTCTPYTAASSIAACRPTASATSAVLTFSDFQRNVSPMRSTNHHLPSLSQRTRSPERKYASPTFFTFRTIFELVALSLPKYP